MEIRRKTFSRRCNYPGQQQSYFSSRWYSFQSSFYHHLQFLGKVQNQPRHFRKSENLEALDILAYIDCLVY